MARPPVLNSPSMQLVEDGSPSGLPNQGSQNDALSPTSIVMNFLKSKGAPLNGESIRTALEQNAREPGYIPGLSNTPEADSSSRAGGGGVGVGGGGGGLPVPPIPPNPERPGNSTASNQQNTSAAPGSGGGSSGSDGGFPTPGMNGLGMGILAGIPAAALMYAGSKIPPRGPGPRSGIVGNEIPPLPEPPPMLAGPRATPLLTGPQSAPALAAPPSGLAIPPPAAANPLDAALEKAIRLPNATSGPPIRMGQPPAVDLNGVNPVQPGRVSDMPVGASTLDPAVRNEANIRANLVPPPQVPLRPRFGTAPVVPFSERPGGGPRVAPSGPANMADLLRLRR